MAIVYQHIRNDKNCVFYIGIELDTPNKKATGKRSRKKHGRNNMWNKIVNKTDYSIQILFDDLTNEEAVEIEKYLISYHGRKDLKLGELVNLTNGRESTNGYICREETKLKISEKAKGRVVSEETRSKLSKAGKGRKISEKEKIERSERMKGNKLFLNKKHSEETRKKMSESAMGLKSKKVINISTNIIYNSVRECAESNNINKSTLSNWLSGQVLNKSNFRYLKDIENK